MYIMIIMLMGAWLLIYCAIKGVSPMTEIKYAFTGGALPTKSPTPTQSTPGNPAGTATTGTVGPLGPIAG
jgi:hypothetical protein